MTKISKLSARPLMDPWRDAFVLRLRLLDTRGAVIGDALAQVDSHCAETGEKPDAAFGDPDEYARTVAAALPATARVVPPSPWNTAALAAGTMLGVLGVLSGTAALADGSPGTLSWGSLASLACMVAVAATLPAALEQLIERRWPLTVAITAALAVCAALPALWRHEALRAPGTVLLGCGAVLLLATWLPPLAGRLRPDRIVDPRSGLEPFTVPPWIRWVGWLPATVLVAAILLIALLPTPH